jgi:hypothetical protein
MTNKLKRLTLALASAGLLTLYGCGGSSSPAIDSTTSIPVRVIDGAIQNATVCLDKNSNGLCDTGEPSGTTGPDGSVNLVIDTADIGKYPVLAVVGTDAIDADTGLVPVAFTMSTPADSTAVVSPLTTLVQQMVASTGASSTEAAAAIQEITGITVSLFQDYTRVAAPTDGSISAATVARMIVVATQQQTTALVGAEGTQAIDDTTITSAQLDTATQQQLLVLLPDLVAAISDPALETAGAEEKEAALLAAATKLIGDSGLTLTTVATAVAVNNAAAAPDIAAPPSASLGLRGLNYTDAANYVLRLNTQTAAQNTPDTSSNIRYVDRRYRSENNVLTSWNIGTEPRYQADIHWDGSAWQNCGLNFESTASVRDANGNATYNYCGGRETGNSSRANLAVAGQSMAEVLNKVIAAGYRDFTIGDNTPATVNAKFGSDVFPAGAVLGYQTNTTLTSAVTYAPGSDNLVSLETSTPCGNTYTEALATSFEAMVAKLDGTKACIGSQRIFTNAEGVTLDSGARNEGWGSTTVSLSNIGNAPANFTEATASSYYTSNIRLRAAFAPGNVAKYYSCQERFNGSVRNCDQIGTGSYTIATVGDARTLSFAGLPALASARNSNRVFVQRAGKLYYGYQSRASVTQSVRPNTVASIALLDKLGLPRIDPEVPLTLTAASYQGTWDLRDPADPIEPGLKLVINRIAGYVCQDPITSNPYACSLTFTNAATGAFTLTDDTSTVIGTLDFVTGTGGGTFEDRLLSVPVSGNFVAQRR